MATKKAHAGVCYLIKKSSIKIHIPGQDGDFRKYTGIRERRKNGKGGKSAREREKRRKPLPDFCRNMAPARGVVVCMYVCKTLFKHASLDNYLQLISTRGVTQIKYISTYKLQEK